jgi:uncharacterized protein YbjT (DUF2867 family)/SAM-dependent methyltransferase
MFVVTGVSGNVGRVVAETLIAQGSYVRVLVRDAAKGAVWRGAEVAVASLDDREAMEVALAGAKGLFLILPEDPRVEDFHGHRRAMIDAMVAAVAVSDVEHVVFLSTTAAVLADGNGPAKDLHVAERSLRATGKKLTVLRATALQENVAAALGPARQGVYPCFAPSSDVRVPMVAARDVGRFAAHCLLEPKSEVIDLTGPSYSAQDIADALGAALGRSLHVAVVPSEQQVPALVGAGLPKIFAEALVEIGKCRVPFSGDRVWEGTTTIDETIGAIVRRSFESLRTEVARLQMAADALSAIGAAVDARVSGRALDPGIAPHVQEVVAALGMSVEGPPHELASMLGEIRTLSRSNDQLLHGSERASGWRSPDERLMRAAGDVSIALPSVLRDRIAPRLDGLSDRLASRSASFLDVGVGVAQLAIEMARVFPALRVVGIDPFAPALALAHEHVAAAGLADRIELREQAGEDLPDSRAFDLVWIASAFVPRPALAAVLARAHEALRPGGWLLLAAFRPPSDPLAGALVRLRAGAFAGAFTPLAEVEERIAAAGFAEVTFLPSPPASSMVLIAARRLNVKTA